MGGEKFSSMLFLTCSMGSPLRGRGKVIVYITAWRVAGITPAWAGKRLLLPVPWCVRQDHPRVGGEKYKVYVYNTVDKGSPPHGRGKGNGVRNGALCLGITPALAGKRKAWFVLTRSTQDHPRMGGEKCRLLAVVACPAGSPPRGRGKVPEQASYSQAWGITPAWAGKSRCQPVLRSGA